MAGEEYIPEFIYTGTPMEPVPIVGGPKDPLVECLEELQAQIDELKARVFSLEGGPSR
jgi:hypothetical protein